MSNEILTLLNNYSATGDFVSAKQPGAGYHQKYNNLHTFVISFSSWEGNLKLQGTLELYPGEDSWFNLYNDNGEEISYEGIHDSNYTVACQGNFTWIRVSGTTVSGTINQIQFSC